MDRGFLGALGLVAAFAVGCATAPQADSPLARGPTGRRALVIVLDASAAGESVREASQAALEAALALTSGEPSARLVVGAVAARDGEATVVAPLEDQDDKGRESLARAIAALERGGRPAAARGVRRALDMLEALRAERGSLVLLLAAERPDRELAPLEAELALRGMKLHAVALPLSARDAVADVAARALGYAVASGPARHVSAGALGGGRLAWIATSGELPPSAGARSLKGAATDARVWDRLPDKLALGGAADDGAPSRALLLYRPTWELSFDGEAPPPIVDKGEPVPISLVVSADPTPAVSALEVSLEVPGRGPQALKGSIVPAGLRYDGVVPAPEGEGPQEARLTLGFALGDARFLLPVQARFVTRARTGPQPPHVRVSPERLDLGVAWVGTRLSAHLAVRGDPERPTRVEVEATPGVSAPAPLELAAGEEKTLELGFDPGRLAPGTRLHLRAEVASADAASVRPRARGEYARRDSPTPSSAPAWTGVVPVVLEAREAQLADTFRLAPLEPGGEVSVESAFRVSSRAAVEVAVRLVDARGVSLEAHIAHDMTPDAAHGGATGERLVLKATADAQAPAGIRAGVVEVRLAGSSAAPLTRPVSVEVVARPVLTLQLEPAQVSLKGRYGWAEARVAVGTNEHASLTLSPGPLEGGHARITPRRDIRLAAVDAKWDGRTLEPGPSRELLVRVYLGSDLPPGHYEGALALRLEGAQGREPVVRSVPVALEVER